jgi:methylmalonyl-CoA/ethylmalonyl-CoA epimerase
MENLEEAAQAVVHLDQIGQIAITVNDLARARNFYQNTLGMKFLFDAGNMCFFRCGDIRLMIGSSDQPEPRGGTILYFKVQNIQSIHASLLEQGVAFMQPPHLVARMPDHDLWMAFLADPDDNKIGLMCEIPKAGARQKH